MLDFAYKSIYIKSYSNLFLKVLLLLSFQSSYTLATTTCSLTNLPFIYGGTNGDTEFYALDIDTDNNIIAGGYSKDNDIITSGAHKPILVFFDGANGNVKWANFYTQPGENNNPNVLTFVQFIAL